MDSCFDWVINPFVVLLSLCCLQELCGLNLAEWCWLKGIKDQD